MILRLKNVFFNESSKIQNFPEESILSNLSEINPDELVQLHQDNVEGKLGKIIIYKTNDIWEESIIIRISKSKCSIGIDSGLKKNSTAPRAAGVIHTDFEKGFIRAETISCDDYLKYKSEQAAKDAGRVRIEGADYLVKDGDVFHFRFNV